MARNLPAEKNFIVTYYPEPGNAIQQKFYTEQGAREFASSLPLMGVTEFVIMAYSPEDRIWRYQEDI